MAKDILIVPGSSNIEFSGSAVNDIKLETLDSGSVAFTSTSGSLFTITNSLTGSLFSVGDVSGVPILDVNSDDTVTLGKFSSPIKVLTNASGHTTISGSSTSTGSFGKILGEVTIPSGKALRTSLIRGGSNVEIDTDGARVVLTDSALRVGVSELADVYTANIVVGSTTPALFLDDSNVSNLRHSIVGGGNAGLEISADIHNATTGYIRFNVGGSIKAQINENGRFGIGDTSPGYPLEVVGATGNTVAKFGETMALHMIHNAPVLGFNLYYNSGYKFGEGSSSSYGGYIGFSTGAGKFTIATSNAGNAGGAATMTERVTILNDGKVGIGTNNPNRPLTIVGSAASINLDSPDNTFIHIDRGAADDVAEIAFRTGGANKYFVGLGDSGNFSDGSEFFIGEGSGGSGNRRITLDSTGETTFTSNNATVEIATTTNGTYGVRSTSPAKFNDYYFNGTTGHIRNTLGTSYMSFDSSGNSTIPKNLTVQGSITAQEFITELNTITIIESSGSTKFGNTNDDLHQFTGSLRIQRGDDVSLRLMRGSQLVSFLGDTGSQNDGGLILYDESGNQDILIRAKDATNSFINTTGNFGFGTTVPGNKVHIQETNTDDYSPTGENYVNAILKLHNADTSATTPHSLIHFRLDKNGGDGYLGFTTDGSTGNVEHFVLGNQTDNEILRVASGGNVGIGSTTPAMKLDVAGATKQQLYTAYYHSNHSTLAGYVGNANALSSEATNDLMIRAANDFHIGTNNSGTVRLTVLSGGNVGIGVTNPGYDLEIQGGLGGADLSLITSDTAITDGDVFGTILFGGRDSNHTGVGAKIVGKSKFTWGDHGGGANDSPGELHFFTQADGAGDSFTSPRMVIGYTGNVGIGTTSPGAKLDIVGPSDGVNLRLSDVSGNSSTKEARIGMRHYTEAEEDTALMYAQSGNGTSAVYIGGGTGVMNAVETIGFVTAATDTTLSGTTRMVINSSGNVGIGTTDTGVAKLSVFGSSSGTPFLYIGDGTPNNDGSWDANLMLDSNQHSRIRVENRGTNQNLEIYSHTGQNPRIRATDSATGFILGVGGTVSATIGTNPYLTVHGNTTISGNLTIGSEVLNTNFSSSIAGRVATLAAASSGITISNNVNNRVLTGDGSNANAEANLIFTGAKLGVNVNPTKTSHVNFTSSDTTVATGEGLAGGVAGAGLLIQNSTDSAGVYANLDFRAGSADGRIAMKMTGTNAGDMHFITDNTNSPTSMMVIKNDGNIGIGTVAPKTRLQVHRQGTTLGQWTHTAIGIHNDTNNNTYSQIGFGFTGSTNNAPAVIAYHNQAATAYGQGSLVFGLRNSTSDAAPTERMRVQYDGKVGIGTSSPNRALTISGNDFTSSTINLVRSDSGTHNDSAVIFQAESTAATGVALGGFWFLNAVDDTANAILRARTDNTAGTSGRFEFVTGTGLGNNSTPKMVIKGDGKVGIGDTTPDAILDVDNSGSTTTTVMHLTDSGGTGTHTMLQLNNTGGSAAQFNINGNDLYINATSDLILQSSGDNIGIGLTAPTSPLHLRNGKTSGIPNLLVDDSTGHNAILEVTSLSTSADAFITIGSQTNRDTSLRFNENGSVSFQIKNDTSADTLLIKNASGTDLMAVLQTGNVGIGHTAPTELLHVKKSTGDVNLIIESVAGGTTPTLHIKSPAGRTGVIKFHEGGALKSSIFHGTDDSLNFYLNSGNDATLQLNSDKSIRMYGRAQIDGNLGIGTASPDNKLEIYGGELKITDGNPEIIFERQSDGLKSYIVGDGVGRFNFSYHTRNSGEYVQIDTNASGGSFVRNIGSGYLALGSNSQDQMYLTSNGRVGIGNSAPGAALHINNDGESVNHIRLQHNGSGNNGFLDLSATSINANIIANYSSTAIPLRFYTGAAERMRISSGGNVGIGNNPSYKLDVNGITQMTSLRLANGFQLNQGSSTYAQLGSWIDVLAVGLYSSTVNGAHLYPNQGSTFGAWRMNGSRNGYGGIAFEVGAHYNVLMSNASNMGFYNDNDNEWMIQAVVNGQVNLFYNGVSKLSTSSAGITVTGTTTSDVFKASGDLDLYSGGNKLIGATNSSIGLLRSTNVTGDLTVTGTLTAQEFRTEFLTQQVIFESGSTIFGNSADDIHQFTGSLKLQGTADLGSGGELKTSKITGTSPLSINAGADTVSITGSLKTNSSAFIASTLESGTPYFNLSSTSLYGYAHGLSSFVSTGGGWARAFRWYNNVNATARETTFFVGALGGGSGTSYGYLAIGDQASESTGYSFTKAIRLYSDGDVTIPDGSLGIGNTNPSTKLHLSDAGSIELRLEADTNNNGQEDCFIRFYTDNKTQEGIAGMDNNNSSTLFSGNTENAMVFGTVSNLPTIFATNNTERITILANGNVGIGTNTPDSMLEVRRDETGTQSNVKGNINYSAITIQGDYTDGSYLPALAWATADNAATAPKAGIYVKTTGSGSTMILGTSNAYGSGITNEGIAIDPTGQVGIGTDTPIRMLDIVASSGDPGIRLESASQSADVITLRNADGRVGFGRDAITTVTSGDVGIGNASPQVQLQVGGTTNGISFDIMPSWNRMFLGQNVKASSTNGRMVRIASSTTDYPSAIAFGYQDVAGFGSEDSKGGINFITVGSNLSTDIDPDTYSRMYIHKDGNIGINDTTPSYKLSVNGTGHFTGNLETAGTFTATTGIFHNGSSLLVRRNDGSNTRLEVSNTHTGDAFLVIDASNGDFAGSDYAYIKHENSTLDLVIASDTNAGKVRFISKGSNAMTLDGQNMGVGTTSPEHPLQVATSGQTTLSIKGGTNRQANIEFENDGTGYSIGHDINDNGGHNFFIYDRENSRDMLRFSSDGAVFNEGSVNIDFRVESNGDANALFVKGSTDNVGIGTTSPSEKLEVAGGLAFSGTATMTEATDLGKATIDTDGTDRMRFHINGANNGVYGGYEFKQSKGDHSDERTVLIIDESGNIRPNGYPIDSVGDLVLKSDGVTAVTIYDSGGVGLFRAHTRIVNGDGSASTPAYAFNNDADTGMFRADSNMIGFACGGSEKMRLDSTGRLGIGDTSPNAMLEVARAGAQVARFYNTNGDVNGTQIFIGATKLLETSHQLIGGITSRFTTSSWLSAIVEFKGPRSTGYGDGVNYLTFNHDGSNQRSVFTGRVGIGHSNPADPLHIYGGSGSTINFDTNGSSNWRVGATTTGGGYSTGDAFAWYCFDNSSYKMTLTTAGRLGIGVNSPQHTLHIDGDQRIHNGSLGIDVAPHSTDGVLRAGNDVIAYYSSDERLKKNVKQIENPIEKVKQLRGVEFDWIVDEKIHPNEGHDVGVIAQDVEKVLPEIVETRKSGYKAVKYEKMVSLLIESVKEQQKQIEELKSEIQELKDGSSK